MKIRKKTQAEGFFWKEYNPNNLKSLEEWAESVSGLFCQADFIMKYVEMHYGKKILNFLDIPVWIIWDGQEFQIVTVTRFKKDWEVAE